jgi:hypothetical protein
VGVTQAKEARMSQQSPRPAEIFRPTIMAEFEPPGSPPDAVTS